MYHAASVFFYLPRILLTVICLTCSIQVPHAPASAETPSTLEGKKVALVIPYERYNLFLQEELMGAFNAEGINVTIVSSRRGNATPNKGRTPVQVKMTIDRVDMNNFDALVFAGGGALYSEFANKKPTNDVIGRAVALNKVLAGIDIGKAVLVNSGLVDYRLPENRDAVGGAVTVSGKVITANAQYVVQPFIESLFKVLQKE